MVNVNILRAHYWNYFASNGQEMHSKREILFFAFERKKNNNNEDTMYIQCTFLQFLTDILQTLLSVPTARDSSLKKINLLRIKLCILIGFLISTSCESNWKRISRCYVYWEFKLKSLGRVVFFLKGNQSLINKNKRETCF